MILDEVKLPAYCRDLLLLLCHLYRLPLGCYTISTLGYPVGNGSAISLYLTEAISCSGGFLGLDISHAEKDISIHFRCRPNPCFLD